MERMPDGGNAATGQFSRSELTEMIAAIRKKIKVFGWLAIAAPILAIAFILSFEAALGAMAYVIAIALFALAIAFFSKWYSLNESVKKIVKSSFALEIREMLENTFQLASYTPEGCLPPAQLRETHLKRFDACSGSDLVRGKYKGVPFAFCDLLLTRIIEKNGGTGDDNLFTVLKGQWIELQLNKPIASTVYVAERKEKVDAKRQKKLPTAKDLTDRKAYSAYDFGGSVQEAYTDNDLFNQHFQVFTDDPQTMYYILTPHFMEYILTADKAADSLSDFCFTGDRVRIALTNERDLFDLSDNDIKKSADFDWVSDKFKSDVRFITDIFDALLKNEYLFGTEEK